MVATIVEVAELSTKQQPAQTVLTDIRRHIGPEPNDVYHWPPSMDTVRRWAAMLEQGEQAPPAQANYAQSINPIRTPEDMLEALNAEIEVADRLATLNPDDECAESAVEWRKAALHRLREQILAEQAPPHPPTPVPDLPPIIPLDAAPDRWLAKGEQWRPEHWVAQGFRRRWGDACAASTWFEILRKEEDGRTEFVILCPTFLRRPLRIRANDPNAWGAY